MKRFLLCIALALASLSASAQTIVGHWRAAQSPVTMGGTAHFRADGTFTLQPDGSGPATGRYDLKGDLLTMKLDSSPQFPAEGVVEWLNKGKTLRIQFSKGPSQDFNQYVPKKGK